MPQTQVKEERRNPWIAVAVTLAFIVTTTFFFLLSNRSGISPVHSAILGLVAGVIVVFIIMAISGILKEFSFKSPLFEMTSIMMDRIENVNLRPAIKAQENAKKEIEVLGIPISDKDIEPVKEFIIKLQKEAKTAIEGKEEVSG